MKLAASAPIAFPAPCNAAIQEDAPPVRLRSTKSGMMA
jgi:hypothetical protein